jgi:hypothetical protein
MTEHVDEILSTIRALVSFDVRALYDDNSALKPVALWPVGASLRIWTSRTSWCRRSKCSGIWARCCSSSAAGARPRSAAEQAAQGGGRATVRATGRQSFTRARPQPLRTPSLMGVRA